MVLHHAHRHRDRREFPRTRSEDTFSFNSPRGWCPTCRGHGRVFPWMIEFADEEDNDDDPGRASARVRRRFRRRRRLRQRNPLPRVSRRTPGNRVGARREAAFSLRQTSPALSLPRPALHSTPSPAARSSVCVPSGSGYERGQRHRAGHRPADPRSALKFLDHVGLGLPRASTVRPTRSPAAKPSASASRPSSAPTSPACSTCSTSPPSASTPATTTA